MRDYELVCILNAGLEDTEIQEMTQRVSGIIQSNDGTVENVRTSEVRRLAYPIKKKTEACMWSSISSRLRRQYSRWILY
ncbi:MAG: hypothetical protein CO095_00095 [Armatimonadetes bacterium CG_4_9_14_3_um_filter_58_7]|nr:MAG: hypothetical protein CO095_00095 [Armatimonadetes bacterium CG_4_9_14_3_um_filter_58_7]